MAAAMAIVLLLPLTGCLGWGWTLAHDLVHHHHVFKPVSSETGDRERVDLGAGPTDGTGQGIGHTLELAEKP